MNPNTTAIFSPHTNTKKTTTKKLACTDIVNIAIGTFSPKFT